MARHRSRRSRRSGHATHGRKGKHGHPLVVAGAVIAGVGLIALLYEKSKSSSAATTVVQGATLPSGGGNNLPSGATGDTAISETVDNAAQGNDPTQGIVPQSDSSV